MRKRAAKRCKAIHAATGQFLRTACFAPFLLLAGCGMFSAADRAERNSPNFRAGYDDGCAAASTSGANPREAPLRDEALYNSNKAYHAGWGNGFSACRSDAAGNPQIDNPAMSPVPH